MSAERDRRLLLGECAGREHLAAAIVGACGGGDGGGGRWRLALAVATHQVDEFDDLGLQTRVLAYSYSRYYP